MAPALERLWCDAGQHHWMRPRKRGAKPNGCAKHGGPRPRTTTLEGDLYAVALKVALEDPDRLTRAAAGTLMRELADTMRQPRSAYGEPRDAFPSLRSAICQALDHRIYGPDHHQDV